MLSKIGAAQNDQRKKLSRFCCLKFAGDALIKKKKKNRF